MDKNYGTGWWSRAECAGMETDLFFPIGNTSPAKIQTSEAKKICASCDVKDECLEFAMRTDEKNGIWGGHTEDERRALKRSRSRVQGKAGAASVSATVRQTIF
jgi:WhiB family redox-sensing transcriptional regulator